MFDIKECKKQARQNLRRHYFLFVFLCLVAAMIGTAYISSYATLTETVKYVRSGGDETVNNINKRWELSEALAGSLADNPKESREASEEIVEREKDEKSEFLGKHIELGHYSGVLAKTRNEIVSGAFIITAVSSLTVILGSAEAAQVIIIILAFLLIFLVWVFLVNVYRVVYARMFMEGRLYDKVPAQHFAYLMYVRKWVKASMTMLLKSLYYNLWTLTVIGGFIKYFSYFAVPYIVAENPSIGSVEAINLSRKMLDGHKLECFRLHITFIGWKILDLATVGVSGIMYSNPYLEAARCEYYAYVRKCAIDKNLEGISALNDTYLYELPTTETLTLHYSAEIGEESELECEMKKEKSRPLGGRICDFLGIYFIEDNYREESNLLKERNDFRRIRYVLAQKEYPYKLSPFPERSRRNVLEFLYYDRKYSVWTLFLFFVFFSCVGWLWEVSLHIVNNGEFVNRGMLYGPWLPIYGTGGVIILMFLRRWRENPVAEFFAAILLCGFVEYAGGFMLEALHHGEKWWNYSGYFFNIDGRVCAEGLLVFGLGGMLVVYLLAPIFDNFVHKLPKKAVITAAIALLIALNADLVYSSVHPNTGKGITSDSTSSYEKQLMT